MGHSKLLTNTERMNHKMARDPCCIGCPQVAETISHVFRDCPNAKKVWTQLIGRENWHEFRIRDVREWLCHNLKGEQVIYDQEHWDLTFGVTL